MSERTQTVTHGDSLGSRIEVVPLQKGMTGGPSAALLPADIIPSAPPPPAPAASPAPASAATTAPSGKK